MKLAFLARSLQPAVSTAWRINRLLAAGHVAVVLALVLVMALGWATFLEAQRGREAAEWLVYTSPWFVILLGMLSVNRAAAALIRWPWRKRHIAPVVTDVGLVLCLVGALLTWQYGIEGQMILRAGERTETMRTRHQSVITVHRPTDTGGVARQYAFRPGAVDWQAGKVFDFGTTEGLQLKVLAFYRHAQPTVRWVADDHDYQGAALRLGLSDRAGRVVAEDWLTASAYGGELFIGPTRYTLLPLAVESMLQDFLQPPTDCLGTAGVLSLHYGGQMYRVSVDEKRGRPIALGESGVTVEIVDYYPDAQPMPDGRRFAARSKQPRHPLLELRVNLPGQPDPIRQVAFAKAPLLNLDGVSGRVCPVKFWYHHAFMPQTPGVVFVQTQAGLLYCRSTVEEATAGPTVVARGDKVPVGGQFEITVVEHIARARQDVTFASVAASPEKPTTAEAAVLVEFSQGKQSRQLWLSRGEGEYGVQSVVTPEGLATLTFDYQQLPLGFTIALQQSMRDLHPGPSGDAVFASTVTLGDPVNGTEHVRDVALNVPLTHGRFTLYQSGCRRLPDGSEATVLMVTCDPGRPLKYIGSLLICVGIFIRFRKVR